MSSTEQISESIGKLFRNAVSFLFSKKERDAIKEILKSLNEKPGVVFVPNLPSSPYEQKIHIRTSDNKAFVPTGVGQNYQEIGEGLPYKLFIAKIWQSGTSAPQMTILYNSLGQVPTMSYNSPGLYLLTGTGNIFADNKTAVTLQSANNNTGVLLVSMTLHNNSNQILINTRNSSATNANNILGANGVHSILEIKVFP